MQHYAGFWKRFAAVLIDALLLALPQTVFAYALGFAFVRRFAYDDPTMIWLGYSMWGNISAVLISWVYYSAMESSPRQATIGKMALGMVVTSINGDRLSFGRASGRYWGKLLSALPFGLGFVLAGFSPRRQALHDIIAHTLVINRGAPSITSISTSSYAPNDETYYAQAQTEIDSNQMRPGLWAKAFEECLSDEILRRAAYLRLRVAQLRAEASTSLPPPITIFQRFISSPFGRWLRRDDVKVILIIGAIIAGGIALTNYQVIAKWIRNVGMTTVECNSSGDNHLYVHAEYTLNGECRTFYNYNRISHRFGTIYVYNSLYNTTKPDGIVHGARDIVVWNGPAIHVSYK